MNIPAFDHRKVVDPKTGAYTPEAQLYNDVLNQQMQENISDDGFVIPGRTTADINFIVNPANANPKGNGTMWYDTTTNQMKAMINGQVKVFTLT